MTSAWKTSPNALCLLLVCFFCATQTTKSDSIDFHNPVRSSAQDEVTDLPNLSFKPNFKHYSGYLEADDEKPTNRFWHYWFVESQSDPVRDPLVLWLNGGPGCSSLLGLLTELGPFRVPDNDSVVENPFAWNKRANIIFMESPAGVGFSYATNGDIKANDDTTARQNHLALKSFLRKFPQYKNNSLYLTGESYGGVYLPTLGVLVDADPELNLKGIAIGNGYLDAGKLLESLVYFGYYHGLVGRSTWQGLSTNCCNGQAPARGECDFFSPNVSAQCQQLLVKVTNEIIQSGVNPYNLYDQCAGSDNNNGERRLDSMTLRDYGTYRENVDKQLILAALSLIAAPGPERWNGSRRVIPNRSQVRSIGPKYDVGESDHVPCIDDSIAVGYLNRADVKTALHIPGNLTTPFVTCFGKIDYTMIYPTRSDGLAPQIRQLISSKRNLNLLIYNGDVDLVCNFFGDEWFVDDLGRRVIRDYSAWYTNNQISGFSKYFDGITYFTIKGSGHMVPSDRPAEALNMFHQFLDGMRPPRSAPCCG